MVDHAKNCLSCGRVIKGDHRYCPYCGGPSHYKTAANRKKITDRDGHWEFETDWRIFDSLMKKDSLP